MKRLPFTWLFPANLLGILLKWTFQSPAHHHRNVRVSENVQDSDEGVGGSHDTFHKPDSSDNKTFLERVYQGMECLASMFRRADKNPVYRDIARALLTLSVFIDKHEARLSKCWASSPDNPEISDLREILTQVDRLVTISFQYPCESHYYNDHFPGLSKLARDDSAPGSIHPVAKVMQNMHEDMLKIIKENCGRIEKFMDWVHHESKLNEDQFMIPGSPYPGIDTGQVYRVFADHTSAPCSCSTQDRQENERHLLRLLLRPTNLRLRDDQLDLLVTSELHNRQHGSTGSGRQLCYSWREVCVTMGGPATETQARGVEFKLESSASTGTAASSHTKTHELLPEVIHGKLCDEVRGDSFTRLSLVVEGNKLRCNQKPERIALDGVERRFGITLADFISSAGQGPRIRVALAYLLARTVYDLYDSDWMLTRWSSETIVFVRQSTAGSTRGNSNASVDPMKPYLAVQFPDKSTACVEHCRGRGMLHSYPRIFALGVLLLELGMGVSLDVCRGPNRDQSSGPNAEWHFAFEATKSAMQQRPELMDYKIYWEAVYACLDPSSSVFSEVQGQDTQQEAQLGIHQRQQALYEKVVWPLRCLLHNSDWQDTLQDTKLIALPRQNTMTDEVVGLMTQLPAVRDEQDALRYMMRLSIMSEELGYGQGVRVAILDTGYDRSSGIFENPSPEGWKDFVDNESEGTDVDGHGTYHLGLLMQLIPEAKVYVARVAESSKQLSKSGELVAQAIKWAWDECGVDIVSMSFGFPEEVTSIEEAIDTALIRRKGLFFAAASNQGANIREMFPARHVQVISIRGTNAAGDFPNFNPALTEGKSIGYGALGVNVKFNNELGARSGTSVATAVAAAYAALLLCYARSQIEEVSYKAVTERLLRKNYMEALFRDLSQDTLQTNLKHLKPWDELGDTSRQSRWAKFLMATGVR